MKYEWKILEKSIYLPKSEPTLLTIPKMTYLVIKGKGNPNNNPLFQSHIEVLYTLSYAIKMMPKKGIIPPGYYDYTIYPLEGVWSLSEEGQKKSVMEKDDFVYQLMIRQPEFVTDEVVKLAKSMKNHPLLEAVELLKIEDGLSLEIMHIGPFDDEKRSFDKMKKYLSDHHLERRSFDHREIYLSDFRRVKPEQLKTVLRYFIK